MGSCDLAIPLSSLGGGALGRGKALRSWSPGRMPVQQRQCGGRLVRPIAVVCLVLLHASFASEDGGTLHEGAVVDLGADDGGISNGGDDYTPEKALDALRRGEKPPLPPDEVSEWDLEQEDKKV